jgi:hypothetical protein
MDGESQKVTTNSAKLLLLTEDYCVVLSTVACLTYVNVYFFSHSILYVQIRSKSLWRLYVYINATVVFLDIIILFLFN